MTSGLKLGSCAGKGGNCGGRQLANTWHRREAGRGIIRAGNRFNLMPQLQQACLDGAIFLPKFFEQSAH